ncbi:uncharacterized protein ABDE67_020981 [Symphorus nematophorus]
MTLSSSVSQDRGFISANVGDNVTLHCFYQSDVVAMYYWYKQSVGQKPRLISAVYAASKNAAFFDEFENNPRFRLDAESGKNHLMISDLQISDSAVYYCACSFSVIFEFANGTLVSVKGSGLNIPTLVHQSASESVQPGGSVTLNCTVHTGTCDGEHSVYWFKNSEESHPGLIYTHGGRNDQCERKPDTQTHTCVYNLPMKSLSLSHAGTYYCAVVSCGHILFGNGTKLDFEESTDDDLVLVYFWQGAFAFTTILNVILAFLVCMMNKRNSCCCADSKTRLSAPSTEGYQNEDRIYDAVSKENKVSRRKGQRDDTWSECVYFTVKQ